MNIVGIVAEYNPFHKGHAHQIQKIREIYGADTAVVCVMSGDFVQRGEPAIYNKYARAEVAVRCGADLVLELPVHFSVASAERFAHGAVEIMHKLGCINYLAFGSECGDTQRLISAASVLLSPEFDVLICEKLKSGCSFPVARAAALCELSDGVDVAQLPNDNLGIEYIKALMRLKSDIKPVAIQRVGAMHDCAYNGELKSGSEIRKIIHSQESYGAFVPEAAAEIYHRENESGRGPVSALALEASILARLRQLRLSHVAKLLDAAEGLENKLYRAFRTEVSLNDIYDSVKSKRYTHARIRRMTMCAALGISKDCYDIDNGYVRVLALNQRGAAVLRESEGMRTIDVLSKPSAARSLSAEQLRLFELTADAHDLYVLGYENRNEAIGEADWITSPKFVK